MQDLFSIQQKIEVESALYIVPTPIGNLRDITLRALDILNSCSAIFCEDSRITNNLLTAYGLEHKKLVVYNDHSDEGDRKKILNYIKNNEAVALVSDAGTPLVSDPGYKMVDFCLHNGIKVIALPGATAAITALSASGISSDKFSFYGFLSPKAQQKTKELEAILKKQKSTICYETSNRLLETLEILAELDIDRKICVAREITKLHEDIKTDTALAMLSYYRENPSKLKGEVVIIIEKQLTSNVDLSSIGEVATLMLEHMSVKDVNQLLARIYGITNKKEIYEMLLRIKGEK